jgi:hypothetical protein
MPRITLGWNAAKRGSPVSDGSKEMAFKHFLALGTLSQMIMRRAWQMDKVTFHDPLRRLLPVVERRVTSHIFGTAGNFSPQCWPRSSAL